MTRAFYPADIMLPKQNIDASKWAVVACDQFTSDGAYWEKVAEIAKDAPSTYNLILPEVYLEDADVPSRLQAIRASMDKYVSEEMFDTYEQALIYIERTDSEGKIRAGIVGAVDLEQYDYAVGSTSLIRATEATVIERIPPRVRIRENAVLELPHIMILIDDVKKQIIEALSKEKDSMTCVYDFDLMQKGGHLKGWLLTDEQKDAVFSKIDTLAAEQTEADGNLLLFAMGDGNHSLATAKAFYEQLKKENAGKDMSNHPARFALCELVNLHSDALEFEAIHRIIMQVDVSDIKAAMECELGMVELKPNAIDESIIPDGQTLTMVINGEKTEIVLTKPTSKLTVGSLQSFLDAYLKKTGAKIDYIHGEETLVGLTKQPDSIGFILPDPAKADLFPSVKADGVLPRKTFSMGHAEDKRYYMECRKIQ